MAPLYDLSEDDFKAQALKKKGYILIQHRSNTRERVKAAINAQADGIEFDVQLTRDSIPILYHGAYLSIGGIEQKICDLSLEQMKQSDQDIISFEELLEIRGLEQLKLDIHINNWHSSSRKGYDEDLVQAIISALKKKNILQRVRSYASFNMHQLNLVRKLSPDAYLSYEVDVDNKGQINLLDIDETKSLADLIKHVKQHEVNEVGYPGEALNTTVIEHVREAGLKMGAGASLEHIKKLKTTGLKLFVVDDVSKTRSILSSA